MTVVPREIEDNANVILLLFCHSRCRRRRHCCDPEILPPW